MGLDGIDSKQGTLRVVFFGTYDSYRPLFRVLRQGLRLSGHHITECNYSVWGRMEDRGRITKTIRFSLPFLKWILVLPLLIVRYLMLPRHDVLIVPYLGQMDMLPARLLSSLRGVPLIFDPFISLYQTVVMDRQRYPKKHIVSKLCFILDRIAFSLADHVFCDTAVHGDLFRHQLGLKLPSVSIVPVGAESELFELVQSSTAKSNVNILFYGWMIPLHGVVTIVEAAATLKDNRSITFTIIGTGQQYAETRSLARSLGTEDNIRWVESVAYEDLQHWMEKADICLGIFGTSKKADVVVPNKVFQAIAAGKPVITGDTRAMREWFTDRINCILVPPGDTQALSQAILELSEDAEFRQNIAHNGYELFCNTFTPENIGNRATEALKRLLLDRNN